VSPLLAHIPAAFAAGAAATGMAQALFGLAGVRRFMRTPPSELRAWPAVTVMKPLHGPETLLAEAVETFFKQDYPALQLVFGVQRADDPAAAVVHHLCARYPQVDATLVVDPTLHGANGKISNLINMLPAAKHPVLVVSDSDMHVAADYVRQVAAALGTRGTGLVTTLYVGRAAMPGLASALGAAYINQIFASGAVMARTLGRQDCLGATMALRRSTLQRIGGFEALVPYVADDGVLGKLVHATGQRVAMAATVPATTVAEPGLGALFRHELRWARTIRAMAPAAFLLSAVQFPVFWAMLAVALVPHHVWPAAMLALAVLVRAVSGRLIERALGAAVTPLWLVPLRDVLSVVVMAASLGGRKVAWRGQVLSTAPDRALVTRDKRFAVPRALAHREGVGT
jgi:ceramide glucosyltransferase